MRRFTNDYNADGKEQRSRARERSGNRCIRCGHPYLAGQHGKGEWTPCDGQCTHDGPTIIVDGIMHAQWRILTVHHFDGDKSNDAWWNTLPLCQRCHLQIQTRVDPYQPYMFEHSEWLKPFVAGFYAKKYEGLDLTRDQVMARLGELLAYERRA